MNVTNLTLRIASWVVSRLGAACLMDRAERAARVVEEAIELAQAEGLAAGKVESILRRVYSRPAGDPGQEAAGVQVCLLAWAHAAQESLDYLTCREVARIESVPAEVTRRKHNQKADAGTARLALVCPSCGGMSVDSVNGLTRCDGCHLTAASSVFRPLSDFA